MNDKKQFDRLAVRIRMNIIRQMVAFGSGHIGGAMSIADVLGVLYGGVMDVDPKQPRREGRDWFVLSKGHAGPAVYAALAARGFFPEDVLDTLNRPGMQVA